LPTVLKAFKICRRHRINVIYIVDGIYYELSGLALAKLARIPLVFRLRANEMKLRSVLHYNFLKRFLNNFVTIITIKNAKQLVCISHELYALVLGMGIDPSKVKIVYHGVDSNRFKPMKVKKLFSKTALFVGNFAQNKGASVIVETAKHLENIHFLIVGPKSADLETSEMPKNMHFMGTISHGHMPLYYNMCDVLVLPSFSEGCPDVILEAFASCKPVVASKAGEIPWIVSSKFGWLIELGNVWKFRNTIQTAFSDERLLKKMGESAREYVVKNFQWSYYSEKMVNILKASCE
jgi:glycosyltransferase involved in cell wall biosynthesis